MVVLYFMHLLPMLFVKARRSNHLKTTGFLFLLEIERQTSAEE